LPEELSFPHTPPPASPKHTHTHEYTHAHTHTHTYTHTFCCKRNVRTTTPCTQVRKFAYKSSKFAAIDKAIGRDSLKFVTLLRLSPLLPLAASNYLYGLTRYVCVCVWDMLRVGQNRIYTPYMTIHLVKSLPIIPYIHRIYIWFWPTLDMLHVCTSDCLWL